MANTHTLLDTLLMEEIGTKIKIGVADRNEYETIRTRLVTLLGEHKDAIIVAGGDEETDAILTLSLCSDYSSEDRIASYYLGRPRRKLAKSYSFTIVPPDSEVNDGTLPATGT